MDFLESDEHRDLRAAVGAIAARFGGDYYVEHARAGTPCDELWSTLGDAGFIGVNVAEEYGGGGGGLVELAIVCEEIANQGAPLLLLLVSAAISAEVIGEFGSPELRKEWLPGPRERAHEGRLRDHRARRGVQHPPPRHHRHPRRRRLGAARHQALHLRASTRRPR